MNTINKVILAVLMSVVGGTGMVSAAEKNYQAQNNNNEDVNENALLSAQQQAMGRFLGGEGLAVTFRSYKKGWIRVHDVVEVRRLSGNPRKFKAECLIRGAETAGSDAARFIDYSARVMAERMLGEKYSGTVDWLLGGQGRFEKRLEIVNKDRDESWEEEVILPVLRLGYEMQALKRRVIKIAQDNSDLLPPEDLTPELTTGEMWERRRRRKEAKANEIAEQKKSNKAKRKTWSKWLAHGTVASAAGLVMLNEFRKQ